MQSFSTHMKHMSKSTLIFRLHKQHDQQERGQIRAKSSKRHDISATKAAYKKSQSLPTIVVRFGVSENINLNYLYTISN